MAQQFISTPGGNIYPDKDSSYNQAEAFRRVALNRDAQDTTVVDLAVTATLGHSSLFKNSTVPTNHNWNTDYTPGNKYTGNPWFDNPSAVQTGLAEQVPSNVFVGGAGTRFNATQIQIPVTGALRFWVRSKANGDSWTPFVNLIASGGGSSGPSVNWSATGGAHELQIQEFKKAYPQVSTGGLGVVNFRYDHGLSTIKSTLLAMHRAAGVPFYVAMNSRLWSDPENSGATQADVRAWIAEKICEVGNHTADHLDRFTAEGIYDTIVNGKLELEAQLLTTIWGFTVPGLVDYNKLEGFGGGSLESYANTVAGGLIMANHAICSGTVTDSQRPLDGEIRIGARHYSWEDSSFASIKAQIDSAITNKTALTLMAHPRVMGTAGKFDAALAQQVISYVKSQIDAGKLANISYYQSHHATTEPLRRPYVVDSSVGRVVKVWDYGNNREQRIYSETGVRDIAGLDSNVTSGEVRISRSGNMVSVRLWNVVLANPAAGISLPFINNGFNGSGWQRMSVDSGARSVTVTTNSITALEYTGPITAQITYPTMQSWPTTLPGTAVGTIPSQ